MRTFIREWFLSVLSLFALDYLAPFLSLSSLTTVIIAGSVWFLLQTIGRPIIKILWLPINIITLGLFSWMISVILVLLLLLFVPGIQIAPFETSRFEIWRFVIPAIELRLFWTYCILSFLLSWTQDFLRWLLIEK